MCLRARFFWNRRTREDLYRALEFFANSIEIDPGYAPAFAGLADVYLVLLDYRYIVPAEAFAMATAASGVTLKPANGGQGKTGQRKWPGTKLFYPAASC
jgi:hypothetical protein